MYTVRAKAAQQATAIEAQAQLWNPHTSQRITVVACACLQKATGVDEIVLFRSSGRGTPGSTRTPGIESDSRRAIAPPSGALLDLADFTVQPTLDGSAINAGWRLDNNASGFLKVDMSVVLLPGTGLVMMRVTAAAQTMEAEVMFSWYDGYSPPVFLRQLATIQR